MSKRLRTAIERQITKQTAEQGDRFRHGWSIQSVMAEVHANVASARSLVVGRAAPDREQAGIP